ncbi:hypothetical protein MKW94_024258 [Papaver nudicaule]|uniref:Uncharacterized protein n=1 Tax=Papaver nudicaule TaxID=74823 RepID=A0AA41VEY8_PAPNU|nr:hypothetical protein [Papaver nudicaule]
MAPKTSSSLLVGFLFVMLIALSAFSETAFAVTFVETCRKNGGIVKHSSKATTDGKVVEDVSKFRTCSDCRRQCGEKCPKGTFLLTPSVCFTTPCPQPNAVLFKGVCNVSSPRSNSVACSCCCLSHEVDE